MGNARRRGDYETRKMQAMTAGRIKRQVLSEGLPMLTGMELLANVLAYRRPAAPAKAVSKRGASDPAGN